ncbi:TonB-dependent receptor [Alteraurantiacibacter palmitatis]|uniref:TonB-dependent receptor n=1 Tax=Alteraurantiacibacter palmitatis TaxID=2054628 RepID=A0ABV7EBP7_9SPHN
MSKSTRGAIRPMSLRHPMAAAALGLSAAALASPAAAQQASEEGDEIVLDTLQIEDSTADVNPNAMPGVPYRALRSGDVRRTQPLSETPQTIQVITETQIEEQGASDLRDLIDNVPGVTIGTGENGNAFGDRYIIRGHEARSDVFVDGLRDPGMTIRETFAVDQIEITKGPSSSFAGRGAIGGAVNSITKQASTDYMFVRGDLSIGTDDYYRGTIDANVPLTGNLAVRANLLYGTEEVPNRNFSERERLGAAISLAWVPADDVEWVVDYYHLNADDIPDLGGYMPAPTGTGPSDITIHAPWHDVPNYAQQGDFLDTNVDTFTSRITVRMAEGVEVINATRYGETTNGYVLTGLRGGAFRPATNDYGQLTLSSHQGNQDVRYFVNQTNMLASFNTGGLKHDAIAGVEYSNLRVANGTYILTNGGTPNCRTSGTGPNNAFCITDNQRNVLFDDTTIHNLLQRTITNGITDSLWEVDTFSIYAMDTVQVSDLLRLHGGLRVDLFEYSNAVVQGGNTTNYAYNDTLWNGHAGISLHPVDGVMVYFNYGTGKEINGGESDLGANCGYGGICVAAGTDIGAGRPESVESLELGVKADLFGNRLLVTAAAFQIIKDGVFESAGTGYEPGGSLNTGKNRVRGVEFGMVGNVTNQLMLQAALTLMDSEVRESNTPARIGLELSNFANTQFSGQARYQLTDDLAVGTTATYKGHMFTGQPDSAASYNATLGIHTYRVPAYWTFDGFVTYDFSPSVSARLNVTNIGNTDYYLAGYQSGHFLYKGDERRAVLTLTGRF